MSDKLKTENSLNDIHINEFNQQTYKSKFHEMFLLLNFELRDDIVVDLVPYASNMKATKAFLFATMDMILRYITEINEHDSPVS